MEKGLIKLQNFSKQRKESLENADFVEEYKLKFLNILIYIFSSFVLILNENKIFVMNFSLTTAIVFFILSLAITILPILFNKTFNGKNKVFYLLNVFDNVASTLNPGVVPFSCFVSLAYDKEPKTICNCGIVFLVGYIFLSIISIPIDKWLSKRN